MEEAHRQAEARRRASEEAAVEQAARSVAGGEMKLGHAKAQAEAAARQLEAEREAARKKEAEAEAARRRAEAEAESARRVSESMRAEVEAKVAAEKVSLDQRITEALAIAAEEWQRAQAEQKRETERLAQLDAAARERRLATRASHTASDEVAEVQAAAQRREAEHALEVGVLAARNRELELIAAGVTRDAGGPPQLRSAPPPAAAAPPPPQPPLLRSNTSAVVAAAIAIAADQAGVDPPAAAAGPFAVPTAPPPTPPVLPPIRAHDSITTLASGRVDLGSPLASPVWSEVAAVPSRVRVAIAGLC